MNLFILITYDFVSMYLFHAILIFRKVVRFQIVKLFDNINHKLKKASLYTILFIDVHVSDSEADT